MANYSLAELDKLGVGSKLSSAQRFNLGPGGYLSDTQLSSMGISIPSAPAVSPAASISPVTGQGSYAGQSPTTQYQGKTYYSAPGGGFYAGGGQSGRVVPTLEEASGIPISYTPAPTPVAQTLAGIGGGGVAAGSYASPLAEKLAGLVEGLAGKIGQPRQETAADKLFASYLEAGKNRPSGAETYQRFLNEQGIPGLQAEIAPLNQQIRETQNVLRKVEGDIRAETGGNVTESQRYSIIAEREKPLRQRVLDIQTELAPKQEELQNKMSLVSKLTDFEIDDVKNEINFLANAIQLNPEIDPNDQLTNDIKLLDLLVDIEKNTRAETTTFSDRVLSPSEAATLGVPYGTTESQAAAMGITPARWKTAAPKSPGSPSTPDATGDLLGDFLNEGTSSGGFWGEPGIDWFNKLYRQLHGQ